LPFYWAKRHGSGASPLHRGSFDPQGAPPAPWGFGRPAPSGAGRRSGRGPAGGWRHRRPARPLVPPLPPGPVRLV